MKGEERFSTHIDIFGGEFVCASFLVDQLSNTDDEIVPIENRHATDRMGAITGFLIHFFVESRILKNTSREKIDSICQ